MREQLLHLAELAECSGTRLQVVPSGIGAHPGRSLWYDSNVRSIDVVLIAPERHHPADPLAALREHDAMIAQLQGERTRMLARIAADGADDEFLPEQLAVELGCSPNAARNRLYQAERLCGRLPDTVDALCDGRVDWQKAVALEDITAPLTADRAHAVEQWVLERAAHKPLSAFTACARRRVLRVDPGGAADRAAARRTERGVWLHPLDDGMAELAARLPADLATAAFDRVDRLARISRSPDDDRSSDAVRADVLADLLTGHAAGVTTDVRVNVTVDAATLAGLADNPAELSGYGPLDAATARTLAADATWRRMLTDPADGALLDVGRRSYRRPAALTEHVIRRDITCRFPGCPRKAESCDLDHTEDWQAGGSTRDGNLGALCRRHHRLKHESAWRLDQPDPGRFRWQSPRGRIHTTFPEPVTDPPWPSPTNWPSDPDPPHDARPLPTSYIPPGRGRPGGQGAQVPDEYVVPRVSGIGGSSREA